jgi:hypothetical protein
LCIKHKRTYSDYCYRYLFIYLVGANNCYLLLREIDLKYVEINMGRISWAGASFAQHFTRRFTANRHNRNLHDGNGIIVRILDYIVGRTNGQFQSQAIIRKNRYDLKMETRAGLSEGQNRKDQLISPRINV